MNKLLYATALATLLAAPALSAERINVLVEGGGEMLQKEVAAKFTAETGIEVNFTVVPYQGVFDKLSAGAASFKVPEAA